VSSLAAQRDKTRRLVKRMAPASFLSDTKWRKAFGVLKQPELGLDTVGIKFLDVDDEKILTLKGVGLDPPRAFIDSFEFGPFELIAIEWLRVPREHSPLVIRELAKLGHFALDETDDGVRIIGHRL
jgi:hypothetical protein